MGVQNQGKLADVILKQSLTGITLNKMHTAKSIIWLNSEGPILIYDLSAFSQWKLRFDMPTMEETNHGDTSHFKVDFLRHVSSSNPSLYNIREPKYRGSCNIVYTFVLLISWPPTNLGVPSWRFFKSPFRVDLKAIQFVIIQWNDDWDIAKILKKVILRIILFFCLLPNQELEHSRSLRST